MKRFFTFFIFAITVFSFLACSNAEKPNFVVTQTGIEPILLDLNINEIPASVDGLYDTFKSEIIEHYEGDYTVLTFLKSELPIIKANVFYGNQIGSIEVLGSNIKSPEGIYPGMKVQELFDKGGKANMSNDGQLTIELGGFYFTVTGLEESGQIKLQNGYATGEDPQITLQDFGKDAKVESILIF